MFDARLKQADLVTKTDFNTKLRSLNQKINSNKKKHLLVENELKKLRTFDLSYFKGKIHFEEDGAREYSVFQPKYRYFKLIANARYISELKSKGFSNESIKTPTISDDNLTPIIDYFGAKIRLKFNGSCLKQNKLSYTHITIVNIYTVYEISIFGFYINYLTQAGSLFGAVKLTKDVDINKYKYSGYGT